MRVTGIWPDTESKGVQKKMNFFWLGKVGRWCREQHQHRIRMPLGTKYRISIWSSRRAERSRSRSKSGADHRRPRPSSSSRWVERLSEMSTRVLIVPNRIIFLVYSFPPAESLENGAEGQRALLRLIFRQVLHQ
jgi:hypothetical protein